LGKKFSISNFALPHKKYHDFEDFPLLVIDFITKKSITKNAKSLIW